MTSFELLNLPKVLSYLTCRILFVHTTSRSFRRADASFLPRTPLGPPDKRKHRRHPWVRKWTPYERSLMGIYFKCYYCCVLKGHYSIPPLSTKLYICASRRFPFFFSRNIFPYLRRIQILRKLFRLALGDYLGIGNISRNSFRDPTDQNYVRHMHCPGAERRSCLPWKEDSSRLALHIWPVTWEETYHN